MSTPERWIIAGHLVPLRRGQEGNTFPGRLYVELQPVDDGDDDDAIREYRIAAVRRDGEAAPDGFDDAPVVDCGDSFVYPGLIDLHSHIAYNALPLWHHEGQQDPYLHHDIWPNRDSYGPDVSWPAWVYAAGAPESLMTYVQVRALAGGTTTIQGWPSTNRRPANQLVRNADDQSFGDDADPVLTSTLTLDRADLRTKAERLDQGKGFIYHCGEGQVDSLAARQFDDLQATNCLRERLIAIHLSAIEADGFQRWAAQATNEGDAGPGALVWSPFSNFWLYGMTTDVVGARDAGVTVCLGTDWGPSGTKNLLGELKVARLAADAEGFAFDDQDLVEMVTCNPGDTMGRLWERTVGRLQNEALVDVAVVARRHDDPWTNLIEAREEQVELVVVDGHATYGTKAHLDAAGRARSASVEVGDERRRVVLTDPEDKELPVEDRRRWFLSRAIKNLNGVRKDPIGAVDAPFASARAAGRTDGGLPDDWLIVELDMPGGPGVIAGPPPPGVVVDLEPIPSMTHDRRWLRSLRDRGFHGGLLDGLTDFFD